MGATIDHRFSAVDEAVAELAAAVDRWGDTEPARRGEFLHRCLRDLDAVADEWVELSCAHKGIAPDAPAAGEEVGAGPVALARYLRLWIENQKFLADGYPPPLPGPVRDRWAPVFPTRWMADRWLFPGCRIEVLLADDGPSQILPARSDQPAVVLGAGNVSSLPVTDALHHIFAAGRPTLLKLNPVNAYLLPVFERALAVLIEQGVLRIIAGDAEVSQRAIHNPAVSHVHLTGSGRTRDQILAGPPSLGKPFTTELGNVTPVLIVPTRYSLGQLRYQAKNVANMLVNNASFNCISAQLLVTWRKWPQRDQFLDLLDAELLRIPRRHPYYPGAIERLARYVPDAGAPPAWTVLRDIPSDHGLLQEECFAAVCGEHRLGGEDPGEFTAIATDFLNTKVWGSLGANIIAPSDFDLSYPISTLRYGTIGVNHWCALGFALMTPPWGAYHDEEGQGSVSGSGFVHDTFGLSRPIKSVVRAPLVTHPKPPWFVDHRRGRQCLWSLFRYYVRGRTWDLGKTIVEAGLGGW